MSSQRSKTEGSQRTRDDFSEEQMEAAVLNVTNFLLCDMRNKRKVRKEDIVVNVLDKSSKKYSAIMTRVKDNLSDVFGIQLAKIPGSEDTFIIVNKHMKRFRELTVELSPEREIQDNLILTVVLASIFMNRGQMFESHLLMILETIGFLSDKFYGSACEHNMKNDVPKLLKNVFVKQMYLEASSVQRPDQVQSPPLPENELKVTVFQWGFRAYIEVDLDSIVDYLKKIHDGNKPSAFPVGYYMEFRSKQERIRAQVS